MDSVLQGFGKLDLWYFCSGSPVLSNSFCDKLASACGV